MSQASPLIGLTMLFSVISCLLSLVSWFFFWLHICSCIMVRKLSTPDDLAWHSPCSPGSCTARRVQLSKPRWASLPGKTKILLSLLLQDLAEMSALGCCLHEYPQTTSLPFCKSTPKTFLSPGSNPQLLGALKAPSITFTHKVNLLVCTPSCLYSLFYSPCFTVMLYVSEVLSSNQIPRCNQNNNNNDVDDAHFKLVVTYFWLVNLHMRMLVNKCLDYFPLEQLGYFPLFFTVVTLSCNII